MGFPHSSIGKESACNAGDPGSIPGLGRSTGEGIGYTRQYFWASLCGSAGKESAYNVGDLGWEGYPLQYSGLENSMDCIVHGVTKSQLLSLSYYKHNFYMPWEAKKVV